MMVYCTTRFKPKKKRKLRGVIAQKYQRTDKITSTLKLSALSYLRPGSDQASKVVSLTSDLSSTTRKESLKYTGTLVKGIATMHKSNAVPVINDEQMKDISRMRRG
jgi:hypothetical protein